MKMKRQTTKQKKNQEHRNIATLSLQLRSYNKACWNSFHRSLLLETFTAHMSSFDLKQIQIKLKF